MERPPGDSRKGEEHLHFPSVWRGKPILPPLLPILQSTFWLTSSAFQIFPDLYRSLERTLSGAFFCALWVAGVMFASSCRHRGAGGFHGSVRSASSQCVAFWHKSTGIFSAVTFCILQKTILRENRTFFSRAMSPKATLEPVFTLLSLPHCAIFVTTKKDCQVLCDAQNQDLRASFVHILFPSWNVKARKAS